MYSTTLTHPATIITESVAQAACRDLSPAHEKHEAPIHSLCMNWVVITDTKGNRRPEMRWRAKHTVQMRDANGSFGVVSVDTTKSDKLPTIQVQQTP